MEKTSPSFSRVTISYTSESPPELPPKEKKSLSNQLSNEEIPEAAIVPACILPNPPRKTRHDKFRSRHSSELFFDADAIMDDMSDGTSDSLLSASRCIPIQEFYKENRSYNSDCNRERNRETRRRSKSVDSIVLDGVDGIVDIVLTSNETSGSRAMFLDSNRRRPGGFMFKRQVMNAGMYSDTAINHDPPSKIMDHPSGLY